jgi:hypothetical protein
LLRQPDQESTIDKCHARAMTLGRTTLMTGPMGKEFTLHINKPVKKYAAKQ